MAGLILALSGSWAARAGAEPALGAEGTASSGQSRVVVSRFSGPLAAECQRAVMELLERKGLEAEAVAEWMVPEAPDLMDLPLITQTLAARAQDWPGVGLVLLGAGNKGAFRLGVFAMPEGSLVGLKTFKPLKKCNLSARTQTIVGAWLEALFLPEDSGAAGAWSPEPAEDPRPKPSDWITPGKVNVSGEDPMFPDRTSSREPAPPPRRTRARPASRADTPLTSGHRLSRMELSADLLAVNRSLSFVHLAGSELRGHEVSLAPALGLTARAFPIPRSVPVLSSLGLQFSYWRSLSLESMRVDGGPALPTVLSAMELGLRYRFDGHEWVSGLELTPVASFHRSSFALSSLGAASEPDVPNVDYLGAKFGLEARIGLQGPVSIEAEFAFLPVFSLGSELVSQRFFEGASGYGISAKARFGMRFSESVGLLVGAELLSYSLDLEPGRGLAVLASDRTLVVSAGLRFTEDLEAD